MPVATLTNEPGTSEAEMRAYLREMDNGQLVAQELTNKGAMHAVRFILEATGDARQVAERMRIDLRWQAMIVSEECARRGFVVVAENFGLPNLRKDHLPAGNADRRQGSVLVVRRLATRDRDPACVRDTRC